MSLQTLPSDATEPRPNRPEDVQALEADARLRDDIRLLGRILGDTVRDQEGDEMFDLVERIRQTSIRFHRDEDRLARRELEQILDSMSTSRDGADRPRLQLFLPPRQHRRGPEQHPPDAGAPTRAAPRPACWPRRSPHARGAGIGADALRSFFKTRAGQPGADGASDRGAPQEHDRPRDGGRGAAGPARARRADAGGGRRQPTSSSAARC